MIFTTASGARFTCGDGTGPPVAARFLSERSQYHILLNPELALGEAYMDGTFVVENGSIADALAILLGQPEMLPRWAKLQWWLRYFGRHVSQFNRRGRAKHNVAHYKAMVFSVVGEPLQLVLGQIGKHMHATKCLNFVRR